MGYIVYGQNPWNYRHLYFDPPSRLPVDKTKKLVVPILQKRKFTSNRELNQLLYKITVDCVVSLKLKVKIQHNNESFSLCKNETIISNPEKFRYKKSIEIKEIINTNDSERILEKNIIFPSIFKYHIFKSENKDYCLFDSKGRLRNDLIHDNFVSEAKAILWCNEINISYIDSISINSIFYKRRESL